MFFPTLFLTNLLLLMRMTHLGCEYLRRKLNGVTKYIKNLSMEKMSVDYITLQNVMAEVSELVCQSKDDYHKQLARKLTNPKTSSKTYWSILKTFYNGRKVSLIPPLVINNKLEADFKRKADHFNNFFASKCTPLKNECFTYLTWTWVWS